MSVMESDKVLRAAPRRQMVEFGTEHHQVRHADDPSYTDARPPIKHGALHGTEGPDPIDPASIGAAKAAHRHEHKDLIGVAAENHRHEHKDLIGVASEKHKHSHLDLEGVAAERHVHRIGDLPGVAAEQHKHEYVDLKGVAAVKHTHVAEEVIAGVFDAERIVSELKPGMCLRVSEDGKRLELVDFAEMLFAPENVARLRDLLAEPANGR